MDELDLTGSLPVRSYVYSPEPIGLGTGMVESFSSYLARLADSHFVSRSSLMLALTAGMDDPTPDRVVYSLMQLHSRELNGMQGIAERWTTLTAVHTHRAHLDRLTFLPWRYLVTPRMLIHQSQHWCPHCLDDWLESGEAVYWPLLWSMRAVTVCPIHGCSLEQRCHCCQAVIPSLTVREPIGFCWKCKTWLGMLGREHNRIKEENEISKALLAEARAMQTFLAASPPVPEQASIKKLAALLEYSIRQSHSYPPALAAQLGLRPHIVYRLLAGGTLVSPTTLLTALSGLGVETRKFVDRSIAEIVASGCLGSAIDRLPPKRRTLHRRLRTGQHASPQLLAEMQAALEAALHEDYPPPLTVVARCIGVKVKTLRRRFPCLSRDIIEKRRAKRSLPAWREHLAQIVHSSEIPPPIHAIASQMKTSSVTLGKFFPAEMAVVKSRRRIVEESVLRREVAAFLEVEPPVSFEQVSRQLGVKTHHIRRHCPDLQQAIVQRFAAYKLSRTLERRRLAVAAVRDAVLRLNMEGQLPTKTKVAVMLKRTHRAILTVAESAAFTQIMHELGLWQR